VRNLFPGSDLRVDAVVGKSWRHRIEIQPGTVRRCVAGARGLAGSILLVCRRADRTHRLYPHSGRYGRGARRNPEPADLNTGRSVANGFAALGPGSVQEVYPARGSLTGSPIEFGVRVGELRADKSPPVRRSVLGRDNG
jgi:hypothetical protein